MHDTDNVKQWVRPSPVENKTCEGHNIQEWGINIRQIHGQCSNKCLPRRWMFKDVLIGMERSIVVRSSPLGPNSPAVLSSFDLLEEVSATVHVFRNPSLLEKLECSGGL